MLERKAKNLFSSRRLFALALAGSVVGWSASARAASVFSLLSSPESWIGGGDSLLLSEADGFSFSGVLDSGWVATFSINDFDGRSGRTVSSWWLLELATPGEWPLTPGVYQQAKQYPYQGLAFPGINFEGNGRGNSAVTGSFEVYELVAQPDGTILSFAADFLQFDEGIPDWWNRGSLRLNSDRPLSFLPLPSAEPPPAEQDPITIPLPPFVGGPGRNLPPDDPSFDNPPVVDSPGAPPSPSPGAPDPVPAPLPAAAALMGWRVSRNLRRRCRNRS